MKKTVVRKNRYLDSVFLMLVARRIASLPGIRDASALLATAANRQMLAAMGYAIEDAGPNDLMLALEGDEPAVDAVIANADTYFTRGSATDATTAAEPRSIVQAVAARPDANVAVISVPGEFAAREARAALEAGLHVFLFSSNVSIEDERFLKAEAHRRGLLVMGPDCGTAYIGGAGIGFANAVRRGPIGIVGATGTGMQEFASLVHRAGSGISHAIGTGSHDLSDVIGGVSTIDGIDALEADASTRVIVILSKPPGPATSAALAGRLARCTKPTVNCLLGDERLLTIDDAVQAALRLAHENELPLLRFDEQAAQAIAAAQARKLRPGQRSVRGLFAGGTLCYQAQVIFRRFGVHAHSNTPLPGMGPLVNTDRSQGHTFVDMGTEQFVKGRPHPMIDATERRKRLEQEARDPAVAAILLDFVLGAIASPDPAGDLLPTLRKLKNICLVASVCGTAEDRQSLAAQQQALKDAGVLVFETSAQAALFCAELAVLRKE